MTDLLSILLDFAERHIHHVLIERKEDELLPLCVMRGRKGETILCPTAWRDEEEKRAMMATLRHVMRQQGVQAYCFISEAWSATQPKAWKPGDPEGPAPSERPDRREIVFALACDRERSVQREWRIVRGEAGTIVKLMREEGEETTDLQGRMTEMLR